MVSCGKVVDVGCVVGCWRQTNAKHSSLGTSTVQIYYFKWKVIHSINTNSKVEARLKVRFSFHESLKSL